MELAGPQGFQRVRAVDCFDDVCQPERCQRIDDNRPVETAVVDDQNFEQSKILLRILVQCA